jgi:chromosome segregation ATPase
MALLKKTAAEPFRVPSLAESSPEYAGLTEKQTELQNRYTKLRAERTKLNGEIEAEKAAGGQRVAPEVARLLGDPEDSVTGLSQRLRAVATEMGNIESAQEILRRRMEEARGRASAMVCATVRPEYDRRLGVLCKLLSEVETARQSHDELLDDLEREDVAKSYLRPVIPFFLGDRHDGKVGYFLKEAREAGHSV